MKILIAALLSAALIQLAPTHTPAHIEKQSVQVASNQKAVAVTPAVPTQPEKAETVVTPAPQLNPHEQLMQQAGINQNDWTAADYIISHESGWCATKSEGEIGYCPDYHGYSEVGYGLCQSTPAIKMASAGSDWTTNAVTQLKWCSAYADSRYGGWQVAYDHWLNSHNW